MFLGIRYNIWHGIIAFIGEFGIALFLVSRTGVVLAFLFAFLLGLMAQALFVKSHLNAPSPLVLPCWRGTFINRRQDG